jgi:hypothetical protein
VPKRVAYFDSQASAAATLNIDIYELRDAKAAGCPAFRSGRVYRDEFICWLKQNRSPKKRVDDALSLEEPEFLGIHLNWERRRDLLFLLDEFLDCLFSDGVLSLAEYVKLGNRTIPLVIKLGRVWNAGIDEKGFRECWRERRADAVSKTRLATDEPLQGRESNFSGIKTC